MASKFCIFINLINKFIFWHLNVNVNNGAPAGINILGAIQS